MLEMNEIRKELSYVKVNRMDSVQYVKNVAAISMVCQIIES